jgi:hypothetical protein
MLTIFSKSVSKSFWLFLMGFLYVFSTHSIKAQQDSASTNRKRLLWLSTGYTLAYTASVSSLSLAWYANQKTTSFHLFNDAQEWLQMDKMGHAYVAYHQAQVIKEALHWSGMPAPKAALTSAIVSFLSISSVEILDGFVDSYGASLSDLLANAIGAGSSCFQSQKVFITPKFSFLPSATSNIRPEVLGSNFSEKLLKDYNGQTYWLGINLKKIFFKNTSFPDMLGVALGYGAYNMVYARNSTNLEMGFENGRSFYLALDIDLTAIKTKHKWLGYMLRRLNTIHLPLPALEIDRNGLDLHPWYF